MLLLIAPATSSQSESEQVCDGDACFDRVATVGEKEVALVGVGRLRYWIFSILSAALYLEDENHEPDEFLGRDPLRLILHFHRDVSRERLIDASEKALKRFDHIDTEALRSGFDQMNELYRDVSKGDRLDMVFEPDVGTSLSLNGEELGTIEGNDFARAFFSIWLSKRSLNNSLRDRLLGRD